jgi:hypothetical protein
MGVSVMDIGDAVKAKTNIAAPLGLFQKPEPLNREVSASAAYLLAKERGLSHEAAKQEALRATWAWQFTYNVANLPKIMRGPTGKLLMQFKPYLIKELEFMSNLSGKEWARYVGLQLALGGPRGAVLIAKSFPILSMMGFWTEAMDYAEEWMNKNAPLASRGLAGTPGLINPNYAVDVTAPATIQFPSGVMDIAGPFLSDMKNLMDNVVKPGSTYGIYAQDAVKTGSIVPAFKYWKRIWEYAMSDDNWLRDENGNKLYHVQDGFALIAQSVAGTENITLNRIQNEERILSRRDTVQHGISTRIINNVMSDLIHQRPISQANIDLMKKHGVTPATLVRRVYLSELPPDLRAVMKAEIRRRPEILQAFPNEADYGVRGLE